MVTPAMKPSSSVRERLMRTSFSYRGSDLA